MSKYLTVANGDNGVKLNKMSDTKGFSILLVERFPDISKMVAFSLEKDWGATVIETQEAYAAIDFMSQQAGLNLVVLGQPDESPHLRDFLQSEACPEGLQFIVGIENQLKDPAFLVHPGCIGIVERAQYLKDLHTVLSQRVFPGEVLENVQLSEFVRLKSSLLLFSSPLQSDVFIRLSEKKFIKLFRKDDPIGMEDIQKYCDRGVEYFYVKRSDAGIFLAAFQQRADAIHRDNLGDEVALRAVSKDMQEAIHWLVNQVGVSEEVQELTKTNVQLVVKLVGKVPSLYSVFERINREMGQYVVNHSLMVSEVACVMASNVAWLSEFTFNKLILAGLFHDIAIKSNELARINTLEELQNNTKLLIMDTYEEYRIHPERAEGILAQIKNLPPDVGAIVRQHHERPDGSGFPLGLSHQQMTPLSCVFIMAHDFVDLMLENPGMVSFVDYIDKFKNKYSVGYYKKIIKSLEEKWIEESSRGSNER